MRDFSISEESDSRFAGRNGRRVSFFARARETVLIATTLLAFAGTFGVVDALASACQGAAPIQCYVKKGGGGTYYDSIQSAVNAIVSPLTDNYQVIVDSQVYSEQVTVQNFDTATNNKTITIMSDPVMVATSAVVNPPAASTAAFVIKNTSVSILNVDVITTNTVTYGVFVSSQYVSLSSVSVDAGGKISLAGVWLSSWNAVSYSSVSVGTAYGFYLPGSTATTVSYSSAQSNGSGVYATYLNRASSNSFTVFFASNSTGGGILFSAAANNNTVDRSTTTTFSGASNAFDIIGSSNFVTRSYAFNGGNFRGIYLQTGATYNTVSASTISALSNGNSPVRIDDNYNLVTGNYIPCSTNCGNGNFYITGSSNSITSNFVSNGGVGAGMELASAVGNTVSLSTFTVSASGATGVYINGGSLNFVTQNYIRNGSGDGIDVKGNFHTVSQSTVIASGSSGFSGIFVTAAASSTISNMIVRGSTAVWINTSTSTVISGSTLTATNASGAALGLERGNVNVTLTGSFLTGGVQGRGIYLDSSSRGLLNFSSNTITGSQYGIHITTQISSTKLYITSNTVISTVTSSRDTYGMYLNGLASGATIQNNAFIQRTLGTMGTHASYAMFLKSGAGLVIDHNRISNPGMISAGSFTAVGFLGVTNSSFSFNDVNSTGTGLTNAYLLNLQASSVTIHNNVFLASFTVTGSSASFWADATSGLNSDFNDWYSSNSLNTLVWGSAAYAYPWNASVGVDANSVTSNPLWPNPGVGSEDFHPKSAGGRWDPVAAVFVYDSATAATIDAADTTEAYANEVAPNGARANMGSYGNTAQASRSNSGGAACIGANPLKCYVKKNGGGSYFNSIQAALSAITSPLVDNYQIIIDSQVYSEQVTVQNLNTSANNKTITIMSDPVMVATAAVVNPPAASTAAFVIMNTSVSVVGINVITTNTVTYGVFVSSRYVNISTVNVDAGGNISLAGLWLSTWNAVSYSSVSVGNAYGFYLPGSTATTVSYSSAQANSASFYAVYLNLASSNTFSVFFASNPPNYGMRLNSANNNTITQTNSYGDGNDGLQLVSSNDNVVTFSTMTGGRSCCGDGADVGNSKRNFFSNSLFRALTGGGLGFTLSGTSNFNTILNSTMTSGNGIGLDMGASTNTVIGCYARGQSGGQGVRVNGANGVFIGGSTIFGNAGNSDALTMMGNAVNLTVTSSTLIGGSQMAGITLTAAAYRGTVIISSNTFPKGAQYAIRAGSPLSGTQVFITSNTIIETITNNQNNFGVYITTLTSGATIQNNSLYLQTRATAGTGSVSAFSVSASAGLLIDHNRVNNPGMLSGGTYQAFMVSGSSNSQISFNDVHSSGTGLTNHYLVQALNGSQNLIVKNNIFASSVTVTGSSQTVNVDAASQTGFLADYNDYYSSNTLAFQWGASAATTLAGWQGIATGQDVNSISGNPLWADTGAGIEDFHPKSTQGRFLKNGGGPVTDTADSPTIDKADTAEAYANETSPNGSRANQGSYGNTAEASETAPVAGGVCSGSNPIKCYVKRNGGFPNYFNTIQSAVNAIVSPLTDNYQIIVDSQMYSEQVTVQNLNTATNNKTITILSDPVMVATATPVNPPQFSTAAFQIMNASVNVVGMNIVSTNSVTYGILVSSINVSISSVNIQDTSGMIWMAGIRTSSQTAIVYTSITVQDAFGFWLQRSTLTTISYSTAANNSVSKSSVFLDSGAANSFSTFFAVNNDPSGKPLYAAQSDSNTITRSYFSGIVYGAYLDPGSDFNTISLSTAMGGLYLLGSTSNTVTQSYFQTLTGGIMLDSGSNFNTINLSTITGNIGLDLASADFNIITQSYMEGVNYGAYLDSGSDRNTISLSTIVANSGSAIDLVSADSNTVTQSYLSGINYGVLLDAGSDCNTISFSTITSNPTVVYPAFLVYVNYANTILNSYVQGSTAVYISGSTNTTIGGSILIATNTAGSALQMDLGSVGLSLSSSILTTPSLGAAVYLDVGSRGNIILSTNTISGGQYGLYVATQTPSAQIFVTSNTVLPAIVSGLNTYGLYMNGLTSGATIQNNNIYFRTPGTAGANTAYGLYARSSAGLVFEKNRFSNPGMVTGGSFYGAYFTDTDNTRFNFNDVFSSAPALANAALLRLGESSINLTLKNNVFFSSFTAPTASSGTIVVADAGSQTGFAADFNDYYSSNTRLGFQWGTTAGPQGLTAWRFVSLQDASAISADPLWMNTISGAEDFHPKSTQGRFSNGGGGPVADAAYSPTIDTADSAESFANESSPNGSRANQGSYGNTAEASQSVANTAGCTIQRNVNISTGPYFSIQSAVNSLPSTLTGSACVVINDAATYNEQVTVQNFANGISSITIMAKPGAGLTPVVSPPSASTAAFRIAQASVNVQGVSVLITQNVPYGIYASSAYVAISSVNVSTSGSVGLYTAGISVSSWSAVSYSTVNAPNGNGIYLNGSTATVVSYSTATTGRASGFAALAIPGGANNLITGSYMVNVAGNTVFINFGSAYNTLSNSTFISSTTNNAALLLNPSSSNTITGIFARNLGSSSLSTGINISNASKNNLISNSTATINASSTAGALIFSGSNNTGNSITNSYFQNSLGAAVYAPGDYTTISNSTMVSQANGAGARGIDIFTNQFVSITQSMMIGVGGYGLRIRNGAVFNSVSQSTMIGGISGLLDSATSTNTILSSYIQGSTAVYITLSTGLVISDSVLVATGTMDNVLAMDLGSVNLSLYDSILMGQSLGAGIFLDHAAGNITLSTNNISGVRYGVSIATQSTGTSVFLTSNTISPSITSGLDTYGVYANGLLSGATIQNNAIYFRSPGSAGANTVYAFYAQSSAGLVFEKNRINNPGMVTGGSFYGAYLTDVDNSRFKFNDVFSSAPALANAVMLRLGEGSINLTLKNNIFFSSFTAPTVSSATLIVADAASQSGFAADFNDYASSNTLLGFQWGASAATSLAGWQAIATGQDANSISGNPLWMNTIAGVEDFHPKSTQGRFSNGGGGPTSDSADSPTLDRADTAEAFANETAPNGNRANQGSYGNTVEASRSLGTALCGGSNPIKCYVKRNGGFPNYFNTIQSAVNAIVSPLTDNYQVIVDSQMYSEQVTVQNLNTATNNKTITILSDPVMVATATPVNPPQSSTAAFQIMNTSVNVVGMNIVSTNSVTYGILVSSAYVSISSVNIDSGGQIWNTGISLSSWSALVYASITVQNASGLGLNSAYRASVSYSTAINGSFTGYAFYLLNTASATLSRSYFFNTSWTSAYVDSMSNFNQISLSTINAPSGGATALQLSGSSNTVSSAYVGSPGGHALDLQSGYNTVINSTLTSSGFNYAGLNVGPPGYNLVSGSVLRGTSGHGFFGQNANYNSILVSTMVGSSFGNALYLSACDSNTISGSYLQTTGSVGVEVTNNSDYIAVANSTVSVPAGTFALRLENTSTTNSFTDLLLGAVSIETGSNFNSIIRSTITDSQSNQALNIQGVSSSTILNSYIQGSTAIYVNGSTGTVIGGSVIVATNTAGSALQLGPGSVNLSLSSSVLTTPSLGAAIYLDRGSSGNIILSTNTISGGQYGLYIATQTSTTQLWIASNTILPGIVSGLNTYGLFLNGLTSGATVQNNNIYFRTPGTAGANTAYGLYARSSAGLVFEKNRLSNPGMVTGGSFYGAYLTDVDNTRFKFNDVFSSAPALANAALLRLGDGSINLTLKNNIFFSSFTAPTTSSGTIIVADAASQTGFAADFNDYYSSNTRLGFQWGTTSGPQGLTAWRIASLQDVNSISADPLWMNTIAPSEDFHPKSSAGRFSNGGGGPVADAAHSPTIDAADSAEAFANESSPNGNRANQGSYGNTTEASQSVANTAGCTIQRNVNISTGPYFSIQSAVNSLPSTLTGNACVVINDAATYNEQVTVQNFTNNGSSITIMAKPGAGLTPVVNPPSGAAFTIAQASVNVFAINIIPTNAATYAVNSSSAYVNISSVNVQDPTGKFATAAMSLASWNTVSYSSITALRHGFILTNSTMTSISYSTAALNVGGFYPLYLNAASLNSVTRSYFSNLAGYAANLTNAVSNTISLTTMTSTSAGNYALYLQGASSNTVSSDYIFNSLGYGAYLTSNSNFNSVSQSTMHTNGTGYNALTLNASSSNTITGSWMNGPNGYGAFLQSASSANVIILSTMISNTISGAALSIQQASGSSIVNSYVQGSTAIFVSGSTATIIGNSVLVATHTTGYALRLALGSTQLSLSSSVLTSVSLGAGVYLDLGNSGNIILSTNTLSGGRYGLYVATQTASAQVFVTSNTILPGIFTNQDTYGLFLNGLTSGATVQNNNIYFRTPGTAGANTAYAFYAQSSAGLVFEKNRLNNPGMVTGGSFYGTYLSDVDNSRFKFNDVFSSAPALANAVMLRLGDGSINLTLKNNVFFSSFTAPTASSATLIVADAASQTGFAADFNDYASSNTFLGFQWGASAATSLAGWQAIATGQDANSISGNPLWMNTIAGAEDFHPKSTQGRFSNGGGGPTNDSADSPTLDRADTAEPYANETAPNGSRANQGSYGNTAEASRSVGFPVCQGSNPIKCYVKRNGGFPYYFNTIQSAVNAVVSPLTDNYQVIVDSQMYSEQVTVQNLNTATNNKTITILSDPVMVATATPVNPPQFSTAAFQIMNTSVNVVGMNVVSTNSVTYGVLVSSSYVNISSVNVQDAAGKIWVAGISGSNWNTIGYTSVTVVGATGLLLSGSSATVVSYSTFQAGSASFWGISFVNTSSNTFTVVGTSNTAGDTFNFSNSSNNLFFGLTTYTDNGDSLRLSGNSNDNVFDTCTLISSNKTAYGRAFYATNGARNIFRNSYFHAGGSGEAFWLDTGPTYNVVLNSTMTAINSMGIYLLNTSSHSVFGSYIGGGAGFDIRGTTNTVIGGSTISGLESGGNALRIERGSRDVRVSSSVIGGGTAGLFLDLGNSGTIVVSSSTFPAWGGQYGIRLSSQTPGLNLYLTSNTVIPSITNNQSNYGIYASGLTSGATIQNNAVYLRTSGTSGTGILYPFFLQGSYGLRIDHNRVDNPGMLTGGSFNAFNVTGSSNSQITFNDVFSSGPALTSALLLRVGEASNNLVVKNNIFFSSFTAPGGGNSSGTVIVADVASQTGFSADFNDYASSNTFLGFQWGASGASTLAGWQAIATGQDANSISGNPLWMNTIAPFEDFHPKSTQGRFSNGGGGPTNDSADSPTLDRADTAEAYANETAPNGSRANQGSYGNTVEASRSVGIPVCQGSNPIKCYVKRNGGFPNYFNTIQSAVNAIVSPLTDNYRVIVDSQMYSEQVTVQNLNTAANNKTITILSDPVMVATATPVNPPQFSTAAFQIMNTSVTIAGMNIVSTNTVTYGVLVSSAYVSISSVNVQDAAGKIWVAGVSLSSWNAVNYTSVTVRGVYGFYLPGAIRTSISYSTVLTTFTGVYLVGASSNSFNVLLSSAVSTTGRGAMFDVGSNFNTISQSTIAASDPTTTALLFQSAASNTVIGSYIRGPFVGSAGGIGFQLAGPGSIYNTISLSTLTCNTFNPALYLWDADSNTIIQSNIVNPTGWGAYLDGGSNYNSISFSTLTGNGGGVYPLSIINNSDGNTIADSNIRNTQGGAVQILAGSDSNSIIRSTMVTTFATSPIAVYLAAASNTVTSSYVEALSGYAFQFDTGANFNTVAQSTAVTNGSNANIYMTNADSNTITGMFISNPAGWGAYLDTGADLNTIALSTIIVDGIGTRALSFISNSSNVVMNSYAQGPNVLYVQGSTGSTINSSVLIATNTTGYALQLAGGSVNLSMSSSVLSAPSLGYGVYLNVSNRGLFTLSTNTISGGRFGLYIATQTSSAQIFVTSNTVLPAIFTNQDTYGLYMNGLASGATIQNNNIYLRTSGSPGTNALYALYARSSAGLVFEKNRMNIPGGLQGGSVYGAYFTDVDNTRFKFNDVHAIYTTNNISNSALLRLGEGSINFTLKNNIFFSSFTTPTASSATLVVADVASQTGFSADFNDYFSSNVVLGFQWGASAATSLSGWQAIATGQDANSISGNPLWMNIAAGAEDFHPKSTQGRFSNGGGGPTNDSADSPTLDRADTAEPYANETAPNGTRANMGSYGNTAEASRSVGFPVCQGSNPIKCYVKRNGGFPNYFNTIQSAVNAIVSPLTDNYQVIVDSQMYSEQVTVQNLNTASNNKTVTILSDPVMVATATPVNPPQFSTAAFQIMNASVNVVGMNVISTNSVTYGVLVSSAYVSLSSMTVDAGGNITLAGVQLSSWNAVNYTSVTVTGAYGFYLQGSTATTVSFSSAANNSSSRYGLFLNAAANNSFSHAFLTNPSGTALYFNVANANSVSASTASSINFLSDAATLSQSSSNTFTTSRITNSSNGQGIRLLSGSNYNIFTLDNLLAGNTASPAMELNNSHFNSVTQSLLSSPSGYALYINARAGYNTISQSTLSSNDNVGSGAVYMTSNSSFNVITQSFVSNPSGHAVQFDAGSVFNTISLSTVSSNSGAGKYALYLNRTSSNTVLNTYLQAPSTAVFISGSTGTTIGGSVIVATATDGVGVSLNSGSVNLFLSSSVLTAGWNGGAAFYALPNNAGNIILSTNTFSAVTGVLIATQTAGNTQIFVTSNTILTAPITTRNAYGIFLNGLTSGATIQNNNIYFRTLGSAGANTAHALYAQSSAGLLFDRNRIDNPGMLSAGSFQALRALDVDNSQFSFNDVHSSGTSLTNHYLFQATNNSSNLVLKNNVFASSVTVTGSSQTVNVDATSQAGFAADFNDYFSSNTLAFQWGASAATTLAGWQAIATGQDANSISGNPLWANTIAGAEDFHPKSPTGRFLNGGGGPVVDTAVSPTIDRADTAEAFANETSPNGSRANQGSYGNTPEASRSASAPTSVVLYGVWLSSAALQYGTVGADGYVVQASSISDFSSALVTSSNTLAQATILAPQNLVHNTTYYLRAGALWGTTTVYAQVVIATATWANLVSGTTVYQINVTSIVVNWIPLPSAALQGSSNSASGYLLVASTASDFSGSVMFSSSTIGVSQSTLTIGGLTGGTTYFFRVASLNWDGAPNFALSVSTLLPIQLAVQMTTHTITLPGLTNLNTTVIVTTSVIITNTGNVSETYLMSATTVTVGSPWVIGTSQGVDRYVLWTVLNDTQPASIDFGVTDKALDSTQACTATAFTMGNQTCVQVPVGATRIFWVQIALPIVTSTGASQDIQLTATPFKDP